MHLRNHFWNESEAPGKKKDSVDQVKKKIMDSKAFMGVKRMLGNLYSKLEVF